jgi:hypothetical protein
MRRESSPLLLLVRVEAAGKGGCYYSWGRGGEREKSFAEKREREREKWCSHHVRMLSV